MEKLKACTYKITHMSVASHPILKLKHRTIFLSFCVLLSFKCFRIICMSMQMRSFVYSSSGQRAISQLLFGTLFGSPGYMAAEI